MSVGHARIMIGRSSWLMGTVRHNPIGNRHRTLNQQLIAWNGFDVEKVTRRDTFILCDKVLIKSYGFWLDIPVAEHRNYKFVRDINKTLLNVLIKYYLCEPIAASGDYHNDTSTSSYLLGKTNYFPAPFRQFPRQTDIAVVSFFSLASAPQLIKQTHS